MNIVDYSDDILRVSQAVFDSRIPVTEDEFGSLRRCMNLASTLDLLKELNCPVDKFIQDFIRTNFDYDKLQDLDGAYILPLLRIMEYEPIDADTIPDKKGMWKAGYRKGGKEWIRYSDEVEPYGLIRGLYLELLKDYYDTGL